MVILWGNACRSWDGLTRLHWPTNYFLFILLCRRLVLPLFPLCPRLPPLSLLLARRLRRTARQVLVETGAGTGGTATLSFDVLTLNTCFFCICTLKLSSNGCDATSSTNTKMWEQQKSINCSITSTFIYFQIIYLSGKRLFYPDKLLLFLLIQWYLVPRKKDNNKQIRCDRTHFLYKFRLCQHLFWAH